MFWIETTCIVTRTSWNGKKNHKVDPEKVLFEIKTRFQKSFETQLCTYKDYCIKEFISIIKRMEKIKIAIDQLYLRIGLKFSNLLKILFGVPERSIFSPVLFIILIADLIFINNNNDFVSYVDDTTLYVCSRNFNEVIIFLENKINNAFLYFNRTV